MFVFAKKLLRLHRAIGVVVCLGDFGSDSVKKAKLICATNIEIVD